MEEGRRWEDMDADCLANIFKRLRMEDLTIGVPLVCRSWRRVSLDPLCWRSLDFRDMDFMPWSAFVMSFTSRYFVRRFSFSGLLKLAVTRSHGSTAHLRFPLNFGASLQDLLNASNECPRLKTVALPSLLSTDEPHVPAIVGRWKHLEQLEMEGTPCSFLDVLATIQASCGRFSGLMVLSGAIRKQDAAAIVARLPKLKRLCLSRSYVPAEQLLGIVDGCRELETLVASGCVGFDGADEEVSRIASRVKRFECEGSKVLDESGYDTDECDPPYVQTV